MNRSTSVKARQIDSLQAHLTNLNDRYQATIQQFDCTLTGAERVKLEAQLASLDRQMNKVEQEIRALT